MLRKDFLVYLQNNKYPLSIFEEYFKEHSEKEWNEQAFHLWVNSQSLLGDITPVILNNKIIPHYKRKFEIVELRNSNNEFIKYVENNN